MENKINGQPTLEVRKKLRNGFNHKQKEIQVEKVEPVIEKCFLCIDSKRNGFDNSRDIKKESLSETQKCWICEKIKNKDFSGLEEVEKWKNKFFYEDLTPHSDPENHKEYIDAIQWALNNPNINNIAITGPYGSGKSSVLKSFKEKYDFKYKCLDISLATFDEDDDEYKNTEKEIIGNSNNGAKINGVESSGDDTEADDIFKEEIKIKKELRLIELSILQQLFYQADHSEIPSSRFIRIRDFNSNKYILYSLSLVLWLISISILFPIKLLEKQEWWKYLYQKGVAWLYIIPFLITVVGIGFIFYSSFKAFRNYRFNKLNITSGEIQIDKKDDRSILNKYLDEIIYFFKSTKCQVVIIEDLDRFNNEEIFTKLRELNYLINRANKSNRVVFIYALKDDMFIDKTRTKFFDFIIPVIPVIHSSNSFEELYKKLYNPNAGIMLSEKLVRDISFFIDDMRMLKNIYNEFLIYKSKLEVIDINHDKLFAFIIYKNFNPSDFADLNYNKGMVYDVFNKKLKLLKMQEEKLGAQVLELQNHIVKVESSLFKNIEELRAVYLYKILQKIPTAQAIYLEDKRYSFAELKSDEPFKLLRGVNLIKYQEPYSQSILNYSFSQIEAEVDPDNTYAVRGKEVRDRNTEQISKIKNEITDLIHRKDSIKKLSLKELLREEDINEDEVFEGKIKDNQLLLFLLKNGHINEHYENYISYFYEGSITRADKDFLLSILSQKPKDFNYTLGNVANLLQQIQASDLDNNAALNIHLVDFLIENKEKHQLKFDYLIKRIINKNKRSVEFIEVYVNEGNQIEKFIEIICDKWAYFWSFLQTVYGNNKKKQDQYLKLILLYSSIDSIERQNSGGILFNYIENSTDFLALFEQYDIYPVQDKLLRLRVKFKALEFNKKNEKLFGFIYEKNLYELNPKMIEAVFLAKGSNQEHLAKLKTMNYSVILQSGYVQLIEYIHENITDYVETVLLELPDNNKEVEVSIIDLLNNEILEVETKKAVLLKQEEKIANIEDIHFKELWPILIQESKTDANWRNVLQYYIEHEISEDLIQFLNIESNYKQLSEVSLAVYEDEYSEETIDGFCLSMILNSNVSDDSFKELIKSNCFLDYDNLPLEELSSERIDVLLNEEKLALSIHNYESLKEHFYDKQITLIKQHIDEFVDEIESYSLDIHEKELLLESDITAQQKLIILRTIQREDINSESIAGLMATLLIEYSIEKIEFDVLWSIIEFNAEIKSSLKLFNLYFDRLDHNEIAKLLTSLKAPYSYLAKKDKRQVVLPFSDNVEKFVNKLNKKGFTGKSLIKKDRIIVYINYKK